jgi:hypothetical protein
MANNCKAKDPNSCRVHGKGGELVRLQKVANDASTRGDMRLYLSTRAEMESLSDDKMNKLAKSFRENRSFETWRDHSGKVLSDTPNASLVNHLYRSASHNVSEANEAAELLKIRGYEDHDLLLAKHFGFEKEGNPSTNAVTARKLTRLTDEIEAKYEVRYPPSNKQAFINKYFNSSSSMVTADRAHCKKFVEEYEQFIIANK